MKYAIFAFSLALVLAGCEKQNDFQLIDDYKVVRIYGDVHSLMAPDGKELVMPNVVNVSDNGAYIIGLRERAAPELKMPYGFKDQPYGYFIYNKKSGVLRVGISREEFTDILKKESIGLDLK